jgi:N-acetylglutamate synthase-like GNAT family acetyltransferase
MSLTWIHESPARWDAGKESIVGGAPAGIFAVRGSRPGDVITGDWWRVEDEGRTVGYGWMDTVWGDGEVLLAVDPAARRRGVGGFILARLDEEASIRGLNYLYNLVRSTHPDREKVTHWFESRGFVADSDGQVLRRRVAVTRRK